MLQPQMAAVIRFGAFELDPHARVLRKHGIRILLQEQPVRALLSLLDKAGEVVTREELQQNLWQDAEFGDFDHSLNIAVNKIREALGASAALPRFIETVPRQGYRFIAPVEGHLSAPVAAPLKAIPLPKPHKTVRLPLAAGLLVLLISASAIAYKLLPAGNPELHSRRLTNDNSSKFGPVLSDGARLYFQAGSRFDPYIAQVPVSGGEPARVPVTLPPGTYAKVLDISPNRQELLLT